MSGTTLDYNGVSIINCKTKEFVQELVLDESNTDPICTKTTITVSGHIHLHTPISIHGVTPYAATAPSAFQAIRNLLLEVRKTLVYYTDAGTVFTATALVGGSIGSGSFGISQDVKNGPTPKKVVIGRVVGSILLEVDFTIEAHTVTCETITNTSGVLSNRWEVEDSIDQNFYTTRTYKGTLVLAGNQPAGSIGPHAFRHLVVPPLGKGFIRERITHATTRDGLKLEYVIVDKQTSNAPPPPASKWSGTHVISTDECGKTFAEISIHLEGPENGGNGNQSAKVGLLALAANIAKLKLNLSNNPNLNKYHLQSLAMIDHLGENAVDLNIKIRYSDKPLSVAMLASTTIGQAVNMPDRLQGLIPKTFGTTSPTGLFVARLQSPCDGTNHSMPQAPADTVSSLRNTDLQHLGDVDGYEGSDLLQQINQDALSDSTLNAMYSEYKMEVCHHVQPNVVKCQVACRSIGSNVEATAVYIPVAQTTADRYVKVTASRVGAYPEIPFPTPKYTDQGITYYLTRPLVIKNLPPEITANGTSVIYSVQCEYFYGMSKPASETLRIGRLPWQRLDNAQKYMSNSTLVPADSQDFIA